MFNGVTKFLEAIDEKTELIAAEADRQDEEQKVQEQLLAAPGSHQHTKTSSFSSQHSRASGAGRTPAQSASPHSTLPALQLPRMHTQRTASTDGDRSTHSPAVALFSGPSDVSVESLKLQCSRLQQELETQSESILHVRETLRSKEEALAALETQSRSVEDDRSRWQREAAYYKDLATGARDQLFRRESEIRVLQQTQDDLVKEMSDYKNSSRKLLEEKETEITILRSTSQLTDARDGVPASLPPQVEALTEKLRALEARAQSEEQEKQQLQREVGVARREISQQQEQHEKYEQQLDTLRLEMRTVQESLEGEVLAHREAKDVIRKLQEELKTQPPKQAGGGRSVTHMNDLDADNSTAITAMTVAKLQDDLQDARQKCQTLSFQLVERQSALDARTRDAADWKGRYETMARRAGDEEVAAAAGYGGGGGHSVVAGGTTVGRGARERPLFPEAPFDGTVRVPMPSGGKAAVPSAAAAELRRSAAVARLARKGNVGRAVADGLTRLDESVLAIGRVLRGRAIIRTAGVLYIVFLQLWVLLLFFANYTYSDANGIDGVEPETQPPMVGQPNP